MSDLTQPVPTPPAATPGPTQTTTEIIKADIAALEARVKELEVYEVARVRTFWNKVDTFFYSILSHARNLSAVAAYASVAAFIIKLLHG